MYKQEVLFPLQKMPIATINIFFPQQPLVSKVFPAFWNIYVNNFPQYATYFCFTTRSTADGRHSNIEKLYKKRCTCSWTWTTHCKYSIEVTPKLQKGGPILILTYVRSAKVLLLTYKLSSKEWQYGSLVLKWSQYIPLQTEIQNISLDIQSQ